MEEFTATTRVELTAVGCLHLVKENLDRAKREIDPERKLLFHDDANHALRLAFSIFERSILKARTVG